jgi:molybdenum cofactor cytidylyltransferase
MGRPKQLLPLGDRTVIEHCIGSIIAAGIAEIVVVLGPGQDEIAQLIRPLPVAIAPNDLGESEMADSVRTGLRAVGAGASGVLICLSDHPLVRPETIRAVAALHKEHPESIIIPCCKRKGGHPTLFPRDIIREISGKKSLRDVRDSHAETIRYLDVADEGVALDMDTYGDYERMLESFRQKESLL